MIKKNGFTIVEVLISVAIMSFILSGFIAFNSLTFGLGLKFNKKGLQRDEAFLLSQALDRPETCAHLFSGIDLTAYRGAYVGDFSYKNADEEVIQVAFAEPTSRPDVEILLSPYQPNYGLLVLEAREGESGLSIPLYIETSDSGILQKCSTRPLVKQSGGGCS